jgi:hypothetical protein
VTAGDFEAISPDLPSHQAEVMAAHQGTPGTGLPAPEPDHGTSDQEKYATQ